MSESTFPARPGPSPGLHELRVLVTGGAGFIGRRLVRRLLAGGAEVRVVDSLVEAVHGPDPSVPVELTGADFLHGDVRDRVLMGTTVRDVDLVYHLAAETGTGESMYRAERYADVNVTGTAVLLDALGALEVRPRRLVLASSRAVYGEGPYLRSDGTVCYPGTRTEADLRAGRWDPLDGPHALVPAPQGAGTRTAPTSVYGETKRAQEALLEICAPALGIDAWVLRLQNVYGPGQSTRNPYTGILSIFSVLLLEGKGVRIFEDGAESRDFVFVDDVVEAMVRTAEAPGRGQVIDVGVGVGTPVLELAHTLTDTLGLPRDRVRITGEFRLGDIRHAFADPQALAERLGFVPETPLVDGVQQLVAWVQNTERPPSRLGEALEEMSALGLLGMGGVSG